MAAAQNDAETAYIPPTEVDLAAIKRILPHRYPFLLVDRVLSLIHI